jgi:glycosyltransferase involved in cell wall biosynthesis
MGESSPNLLTQGVSLIVPVFGGAQALVALVSRSSNVLRLSGEPYEIILVDDASVAPTCDVARRLAETVPNVTLLRFARNAGQHAALLAGVRAARYAVAVTLDDDLQNPPEQIPLLLARLAVGDADVVYGTTSRTSHPWCRRLASWFVRRVVASAAGNDVIFYSSPFRAFKTQLREGFAGAAGPGVSLSALLGWSTQRVVNVEVQHDERFDGHSGYTLRRLTRFAFDILTGYSTSLLNVVSILGIVAVTFGLAILAWVLGRYFLFGTSVAGFPFLALSIALFSGAQMLSLGIIGQYLGRVHMRVQGRPTYHIVERIPADGGKL